MKLQSNILGGDNHVLNKKLTQVNIRNIIIKGYWFGLQLDPRMGSSSSVPAHWAALWTVGVSCELNKSRSQIRWC